MLITIGATSHISSGRLPQPACHEFLLFLVQSDPGPGAF